ncbi:MAG: malto-oligosyltrehalose trehalohydrolase [Allosphingosinicella sp.]|uniref:malto-oligosyltrehalose trehalohydrolase n=1 Tax=Allosphingosinicella sp. TaxID=2823234 RepID=UPI00395B2B87
MRWGPEPLGGGRWRFNLWAPGVERVNLEIAAPSEREGLEVAMSQSGDGWFSAEAEARSGTRYRFRVSPDLAVPDPASRAQAEDVHGWSLLVDPDSYRWQAADWAGRPWEETVIYELHAGLLGGFRGVADRLPDIAALGVTAVELMPVAAFSGTRNWGYDGVLPYAPAAAYGSPDDLKALVDKAHALGLSIYLDVVYNHFGPDGNYLHAYANDFFHPEIRTPWGDAIAFDREPVRRFFIDNALMWLTEYRFDGLRFDAVHAIGDVGFLDAMAAELRAATVGRHVHLMLENEANDAERLERGFDAQWNDDFHNTIHVMLTGESEAYYGGFAERPAEKLARCLAEGFVYQGETPPGGDHPRGAPSGHLRSTAFIPFLQNHDQIGNRAMGERLTRLTSRERLRAATALLLLMPQVPLLFMGDETGSESPFLFFTDFHDELADAVREGRRREFAKFAAFADPEARARIPDPNAEATFAGSRPEPGPAAAEWRAFYADLLDLRRREIVPRLKGARGDGARALSETAVLAHWRLGDGSRLTIFADLGETPTDPSSLSAKRMGRGTARSAVEGQPAPSPLHHASHGPPPHGFAAGRMGAPLLTIPGFAAWLERA